jgi:hypothetical protein
VWQLPGILVHGKSSWFGDGARRQANRGSGMSPTRASSTSRHPSKESRHGGRATGPLGCLGSWGTDGTAWYALQPAKEKYKGLKYKKKRALSSKNGPTAAVAQQRWRWRRNNPNWQDVLTSTRVCRGQTRSAAQRRATSRMDHLTWARCEGFVACPISLRHNHGGRWRRDESSDRVPFKKIRQPRRNA